MNGLDKKPLFIGSLKISQKRYLKIFILIVFIACNFRLDSPINSGESLLSPQQNLKQQSFVSKALNISGDAEVTIDTERTISTAPERFFPPGVLNDGYFEHFFGLRELQSPRSKLKKIKKVE